MSLESTDKGASTDFELVDMLNHKGGPGIGMGTGTSD